MTTDRITLTVPAKSEYAKTVRMTAAALVSRMGMTYDEVDDVRIAAEEAFIYAAGGLPEGADVRFEFTVAEDELAIDVPLGHGGLTPDEEASHRASYARFILESVCDSFEFTDAPEARMHLVKRLGASDADEE